MSDTAGRVLTDKQLRELLYLLRHIGTDKAHAAQFVKEITDSHAALATQARELAQWVVSHCDETIHPTEEPLRTAHTVLDAEGRQG